MTTPSQNPEARPQPSPARPVTAASALVALVRALARSAAARFVGSGGDDQRKPTIRTETTRCNAQQEDG